MAKSIENKIKELEYKAGIELKQKIYKKQIMLDTKYQKKIYAFREKLSLKVIYEMGIYKNKAIRQVDTKLKNKIRAVKGHKLVQYKKKEKTKAYRKKKRLHFQQRYSRMRDGDVNGYCKCISCINIRHRTGADGGHMFSSSLNSVAFDMTNINLQCKACNGFKNGNFEGYKPGYIAKYGQEAFDKLSAKRNQIVDISKQEMKEQALYREEQCKILEAQKY